MKRRVVSLWLPTFPTDLLEKRRRRAAASGGPAEPPAPADGTGETAPLITFAAAHGGLGIAAVNGAARLAGLKPGMALADARARVPGLLTESADEEGDAGALGQLADWCRQYTPWTAVDISGSQSSPQSSLWLDISGCAHLLGGEQALLEELTARLDGLGFGAVATAADTPGAAWAVARFGTKSAVARFGTKSAAARFTIVPPGEIRPALVPLPVAGLRLGSAVTEGLSRIGLRRIGDLLDLPRGPLTARFGEAVTGRLDQALGSKGESLSPRRPVPPLYARLAFAEPIGHGEDIARAARHLLNDLCRRLELAHRGARRMELTLYRVDGSHAAAAIGTHRPERHAGHLQKLLAEKLDRLEAGFGVEVMVLAATAVDPLPPSQVYLNGGGSRKKSEDLARLVDRLGNRLGPRRVIGLAPCASHIPERAWREVPALSTPASLEVNPARPQARPVRLLPWPEPIEAIAPVPDHAPVMFRWRQGQHRVTHAEGPERIGAEWWLAESCSENPAEVFSGQPPVRDYYRVEDSDGRRFWLYREGLYRPGVRTRWFLHGMFP